MSWYHALTFILFAFPTTLYGQSRTDGNTHKIQPSNSLLSLMESSERASDIVARAVSALGGWERLRSLKALSLDFEADVVATFQGVNPKSPHRKLARTGNLTFNIDDERLATRTETVWPNFTSKAHSLYREGKTYDVDENSRTYRSRNDKEVLEAWKFRLAPVLLKNLSNRPMSLRYEGTQEIDGRKYEAVSAPMGDGQVYRFYFSPETYLLEIVENLHYSSDFGDILVRRVFSDPQIVDGITLPTQVKMAYNGNEIFNYKLKNLAFGPKVKLQLVELPEGFQQAKTNQAGSEMQTRSIAEHVYLIENLAGRDYNVMFADLGEFLIVFEAPIDLWASNIAMAEIRKVFPEKPIRFVMVTHFHDDHAAGVRTYMAQGISVITTPGNRAHFETVARLKHSFHAENNLLTVAEPKFEIVKNRFHEIKGNNLTVQFLDLGPNAHVDENIVAYIPDRGILFQGDFFRVPPDRTRPERLRDEGVAFLNSIKEKNLTFNQLVGAHGPIGSIEDLERAYELRAGDR